MKIAETLGKYHHEVEDAPADEYDKWVAFLRLKEENRKRNERKQQAQVRNGKRG